MEKIVSELEDVDASISQLKLSRASPSSYLPALGGGPEMKTQSRTKYTEHYVIHELEKGRDLGESSAQFWGFLQLSLSLHKGSRGTDGKDTALPRCTFALAGGSAGLGWDLGRDK